MANRLDVGKVQIEYVDDRSGTEPLLLVHGGLLSDWFVPVAGHRLLAVHRVITMRRAGYVRAEDAGEPLSIAERAAHCARLVEALGIDRVHVCGHSSGAVISLQLALDRPDLVQSLVLLEPAPVGELASPAAIAVAQGPMRDSMMRFGEGDAAAGFDLFMRATCAEDYPEVLEAVLGEGALARAIEESRAFPAEAGACAQWTFGAQEAGRLTVPVMAVAGTATAQDCPLAPDSVGRLADLVPQTEVAWLEGANHMMTLEDPAGVSGLIASFVARHPIATLASAEG